jgi:hypothetical protein
MTWSYTFSQLTSSRLILPDLKEFNCIEDKNEMHRLRASPGDASPSLDMNIHTHIVGWPKNLLRRQINLLRLTLTGYTDFMRNYLFRWLEDFVRE